MQYGSKLGFASNGELPPTNLNLGPIDLHSGHTFNVSVGYDGKMLKVAIVDMNDPTKVFTTHQQVDLVKALGSKKVHVGFTAATGDAFATQDILTWRYAGNTATVPVQPAPNPRPTIAAAAHATPNPSSGTSTNLSVLGHDATGESNLTYTWRVTSAPSGMRGPTFTLNRSNAAKNTVAHFFKDGTYTFRVTVTNKQGLTANSSVKVNVVQKATAIALSPHRVETKVGRRVQFKAVMLDQFNRPMRMQPAFRFFVQSGGGKMSASTGMYTAPSDPAHVVIEASASGIAAAVGVTVYPKEERPDVTASS